MKPDNYYRSLSKSQRTSYAEKAGTTLNYLVAHVFRDKGPMRRPSNSLLIGLANASEGQVSLDEAIDYFLVAPVRKLADEMSASTYEHRCEQPGSEREGFDTGEEASL